MSEWLRLVRTVAPSSPAVSVDEIKRWSRSADFSDDDDILEMMVAAAQAAVEGPNGIGLALTPQTWKLSLDYFPCEITIPLGPVTAITSISYTDANGDTATVSDWRVDLDSSPCKIWPARDTAWPAITCEPGAVKVTFDCGFTETPADLKAAICLLAAHFYNNREAVTTDLKAVDLPMGVDAILNRYRVGRVA